MTITLNEGIALGALLCNIILTSLALWRGCQAVKEIRGLRKDRNGSGSASFIVPLMILAMLTPALAEDHVHTDGSDWIRSGKHLNSKGESCCGLHDCTEIDGAGISTTSAGYFIRGLRETVPYSETKRSEDGKYWRCQWGGERKCFFAPPPST
jgi:hypothetical protein